MKWEASSPPRPDSCRLRIHNTQSPVQWDYPQQLDEPQPWPGPPGAAAPVLFEKLRFHWHAGDLPVYPPGALRA